jgi:hypothetical protein
LARYFNAVKGREVNKQLPVWFIGFCEKGQTKVDGYDWRKEERARETDIATSG